MTFILIIKKIFFFLAILSAILTLFFTIGIIWLLLNSKWLKDIFLQDLVEFLTFKAYGIGRVKKAWEKISKRLGKNLESEAKLAIIEAEALLDDVLKKLGYKGETFGERVKQLPKEILPGINEVLEAHSIHNKIVHDPTYRLSLDQAETVLEIYKKALQDLEAF